MIEPLLQPNIRTVRNQSHFLFDDPNNRSSDRTRSFDSDLSFTSNVPQFETKTVRQNHSAAGGSGVNNRFHSNNSNSSSIQLSSTHHRGSRFASASSTKRCQSNTSNSVRALTCFRTCGTVITWLFFLLAFVIGGSGILNVDVMKGKPASHTVPQPPDDSQGKIKQIETCIPGTGWNYSTGCIECQTNWNNANGLCNECAANHYGLLCLQCHCSI